MPISTWHKRKCKECGDLFYIRMGDCITIGDLIKLNRSICDECRRKIYFKYGNSRTKK